MHLCGKALETLFLFIIQYNGYFYCMTMLYMCLLASLGIETNKRKLRTKACKITHSSPLNNSISPRNERNDQEPSPFFQEEVQQQEDGMPINS